MASGMQAALADALTRMGCSSAAAATVAPNAKQATTSKECRNRIARPPSKGFADKWRSFAALTPWRFQSSTKMPKKRHRRPTEAAV
jgi:hypothetical protein